MATILEVRPETALEAVHASKSTPFKTPRETVQTGKSTPTEKSEESKNGDCRRSPETNNNKAKSPDQKVPRPHLSKYTNFTDLIGSREEVFLATEQTGVFKWPDPLREDRSKRNQNKYYRYHKDVGHTTIDFALNDCHAWSLLNHYNLELAFSDCPTWSQINHKNTALS